jgi:hypothetical protein
MTGNAQLTVITQQRIGDRVVSEGAPVSYDWRWYYFLPNLAVWVLAGVFFLLTYRRAAEGSNLVALPIVLTVILISMEGWSILVLSLIALGIGAPVVRRWRCAHEKPVDALILE